MRKARKVSVLTEKNQMSLMAKLLEGAEELKNLTEGDFVTGTVVEASRLVAWIDVENRGLGYVYGKELGGEKLKRGETVTASVIEVEDEKGYMVLSLRRGMRQNVWRNLEELKISGDIITVRPTDANQGGLIIEQKGIKGFLPVSQLSAKNYPSVGGNKGEILSKLKELVYKDIAVKVLDADPKANKLIFTEKGINPEQDTKKVSAKFKIGDELEGKVTGIVDFGAFVDIGGMDGLVHISEISWQKVNNIADFLKIGDKVKVIVIDVQSGKVFLSIKRLEKDPWQEKASAFKEGDISTGTITRVTPFGAFVSLENDIEGLVHVSEISKEHVSKPEDVLAVGDKKAFKIVSIDKKGRKINLSLKRLETESEMKEAVEKKPAKKAAKAKIEKEEAESPKKTKSKEKKDAEK